MIFFKKLLFLKRPIFCFNNMNWMVCAPCGWMHFEAYFWNVSNLISETIGLNERVARTLEWMTDHRRRGLRTRYTHTQIHIHKYKYTNTQILKYKNTNKSYKNTKVQQITMNDWPQEERLAHQTAALSLQPAALTGNLLLKPPAMSATRLDSCWASLQPG